MPIVESFVALCLLLVLGHYLRMHIRLLQKLYLPSCVIGGLAGLIVVQVMQRVGYPVESGWVPGWGKLPGFLINIVFACLFLGVRIPPLRILARRAGPQLAYGQTVAWGQYVVGVGLTVALLTPLFGVPAMFGGILPVGFEGGHGTAAGMGPVFEKLGWEAGKDFGLASASAGIISAIVFGMVLVNWATRRGYTARRKDPESVPEDDSIGVIPIDRRPSAGRLTVSSDAVESFSLHLGVVGVAVLIGFGLKQGLVAVAQAAGQKTFIQIADSFPLFPLCMLGGLVVQLLEDRFDRHHLIDVGLTRRIQNTALDFLVVAAIATIRIEMLYEGLAPFVIVVAAGIAWNVFCVVVLARRLLPNAWFERSIAEMGQSMGVTATGLLLLRVVDPDYETPAADAFASKQLLHEPFMGGGLWTSMAIPLLALWGPLPVLYIAVGAVTVWVAVLLILRGLRRPAAL
ncbi:MAG TPA: sodium/glutamate symporter [Phycisphaerae bacterium]|nr:sodium/glutamate symporter [Phycisphaerae bacterium]HUT60927.1 sodium/glutamate symporter [Phycisphaerae bacterium]